MRNRFKIILGIILSLILLSIIILIAFSFKNNDNKIEYVTLDSIKGYNYTLQDRDTKLMNDVFSELKYVLESEDIDYSLYATYLSELFVIDLFTMDNKDNKYDVGSIEYVFEDVKDNFVLNVEDTLYKYLIDKNISDREDLPIVNSIKKDNLEETKYVYNEKEYDAYKILLSWDYKKDLGYPKSGEIILIKDDNKLKVVSFKGVEE